MSTLPAASPEALAISQALGGRISQAIADAGGWIPFSHYMELALYASGMGYYAAGSSKLGEAGDFITAPELTPLFGQALARQLAELLPQTAGAIYEFGAGTGKLAIDVLAELEALGCLPQKYVILDLSPDLIERQRQNIRAALPHLADRVEWASRLPDAIDGVVIGNELLDAMPCEMVFRDESRRLRQRGVTVRDGALAYEDRDFADARLAELAAQLVPDIPRYETEISLANRAFVATVAGALSRGAILLIDYGHAASEYYHPERSMGTLLGHYRHHTVQDPFYLPGLMDLTCHVDFSAVAQSGLDAGLDLIGYASQAQFLLNCGIVEALQRLDPNDVKAYLPVAKAVQRLLSPQEMGETFKAIGFGKGVDIDWQGFARGDRCYTL
ncbi:class I SAM-dependent methyltransferase [Chromobacterium subtsugae]|uniref:class I SAM-dependent methyltransferase n=1 Tax=Chromobacterium subtsugae TaxID=251747 RepID=UPI000640CDF6|nr:SAM-dependent methyltransferase [Chromobacterium subtsugae]